MKQHKMLHLRVAVAVSTTAAAPAALQKPQKCSTGSGQGKNNLPISAHGEKSGDSEKGAE